LPPRREGIKPLIALNKSDLTNHLRAPGSGWHPIGDMGYHVLPIGTQALGDAQERCCSTCLSIKTTLVLGPSGAGKSTLINRLAPGALVP
jgi:ribosome biogenesis GTPase